MRRRYKSSHRTIPTAVKDKVYATWGTGCWLQFPGCTGVGDTLDHIIPAAAGGKMTADNLRPCCGHCNSMRHNMTVNGFGADIHCVIGPPESGKTTYVREHRQPGDIVLDYDELARCLAGDKGWRDIRTNKASKALTTATLFAWSGAYNSLTRATSPVGVWIIKALPYTDSHPRLLDEWIALGYEIRVCDPGVEETMRRVKSDRRTAAVQGVRKWYSLHLSQSEVDAATRQRAKTFERYGLIPQQSQTVKW